MKANIKEYRLGLDLDTLIYRTRRVTETLDEALVLLELLDFFKKGSPIKRARNRFDMDRKFLIRMESTLMALKNQKE